MNFKEELQTLCETHKSPKLDNVRKLLMNAASKGERSICLDSIHYDRWVLNWLRAQGLEVDETFDQRQGDFVRISW